MMDDVYDDEIDFCCPGCGEWTGLHGDCSSCQDDARRESEDESASMRGTSECDGRCAPMCDWCLVGHECPTQCTAAGIRCPYDAIA